MTRQRIDGRTHTLRITPEGRALNDEVIRIGRQREDHLFGPTPHAQQEMLRRMFLEIRDRAIGFSLPRSG